MGAGIASLLLALLPMAVACQTGKRATPLAPEVQAQWTRDSARYVRDSLEWERGTHVRDSVSRTIGTDSVFALYRSMLHAANPIPIWATIQCVEGGIDFVYGGMAGEDALKRMRDTVWKPDERDDVRRLWRRSSGMSTAENMTTGISPGKCHWGARRDSVDGVPLHFLPNRPERPKRPAPSETRSPRHDQL